MRNTGIINEDELRKALAQLKPDGELYEIRIIGNGKPISGYFKDTDTLIKAFESVDLRNTNVYITLNGVKESLYSRQQADRFLVSKNTTSDKEVKGYDWLFIDLDPKRETGISSSEEELQQAKDLADKVRKYMRGLGFAEPIRAMSGNGCHLLYKVMLANTDENKHLIERCLKSLALMFNTETVEVDTSTFNPSRICKLYGTKAQKGRHTEDRPHRMSYMIGDVHEVYATQRIYLEKLASDIPEEEVKPAKYNNYNPGEFDIEEWLSRNGLRYKTQQWNGRTKYVLDECPFDSNHKAPDSCIIKQASGAIGFKCLHNSCQGKTWRDVRIRYEPDAYEKKDSEFDRKIEEGWRKHNRDKKAAELIPKATEPTWQTIDAILKKPTPDTEYILTRIGGIDKKMHGLMKGGLSVVSGLRAAAKSTLVSQISLHAINDGHNVICYSGELKDKRFARWLIQQAAGRQYTKAYEKDGGTFYYVPDEVQHLVSAWIGEHLWLYNNSHGSDYSMVINSLEEKIKKTRADLVILDNLMMLNLFELDVNEYRAQTLFMQKLKQLAETYNCHICLICHPRKTTSFLRLVDIAGSANISNLIDSCFIVHRNNHDFQKYSSEEFGWKASDPVYEGTNVIEIAKDREEGIQDEFIPLWYEVESRRMKNNPTETIRFAWTDKWEDDDGFRDVPDDIEISYE